MKYKYIVFLIFIVAIILILVITKGIDLYNEKLNEVSEIIEITLVESPQLCLELSGICKAHSNACDELPEKPLENYLIKADCYSIWGQCFVIVSDCEVEEGVDVFDSIIGIIKKINEFWKEQGG